MTTTATPEKLEFKTELKQLLHLIAHSLYSHREIFLRELISNASDAINKVKFDALAHEDMLEDNKDWKIRIVPDRASSTLTISDNGIGMSREGVIDQLGTIAKSGTRAYLEHLRQSNAAGRPDLIGQFGVGFYSAFMVADRVTVVSRPAGGPHLGVRWESDGQGEFTVEAVEKPTRGTDVILHLKEDAKEFLDGWALQQLVKKFSNFIEHPVVMDVEKGEGDTKEKTEEVINARAAIWLRPKKEVTADEYRDFYQQISGHGDEPARVVHYAAEGQQEYKVLLFLPTQRPFELEWGGDPKIGPRLYIQRVLIMEHCEALLPPYLRFVKGVVDSSDLPLNISREILQQNPLLDRIQKDIVRTVLKELQAFKEDEYDKYVPFFQALGDVLKEGVGRDWTNREKIADLLLFGSLKTPAGQYTTLEKYVEAMPAEQKDIVYLTGDSRAQIENSPYLEVFRDRGQDVLLLTEPVDEFLVSSLHEYKGKKLVAADRSEADADKNVDADKAERYKGLIEYLKKTLPEVSDVRLSRRLKESAACLVAGEHAMTAHMERLLQRMGRAELGEATKRILELNPDHPALEALQGLHARNADDARLEGYARLLYDQAVIAEGSKIKDAAGLARRINELLARDAAV